MPGDTVMGYSEAFGTIVQRANAFNLFDLPMYHYQVDQTSRQKKALLRREHTLPNSHQML
jgi:hypothetical protein